MRSATGRRVGISRVYSLKPVTLPTDGLPARLRSGLRHEQACGDPGNTENALVLVREYLDELRQHGLPILQDPLGLGAAGQFAVAGDQPVQQLDVFGIAELFEVYFRAIAIRGGGVAGLGAG